jgi:pyruvate,water dikinase
MLSHAAVVARELGRPCVSQIDGATQRFTDGQSLTVDGRQGLVWAV